VVGSCSNGIQHAQRECSHRMEAAARARVARLALLEPKTRNLALLRSSWLQNFYLATFWLFCNISFHKFFLEKSCEWCVQLVPATMKLDVGQHTVMFEPDKKSIEHKHTVSTMQIDNNRHRGFLMALG